MSYEAIALRLPGVGSKRVCVSCAARVTALARPPPVCPKCRTEPPPEPPRAAPIRRAPSRGRMMKAPVPAARDPDDDAAPVLDTDEDEAEADEDAEVADADLEEEPDAEAVLDEPEP